MIVFIVIIIIMKVRSLSLHYNYYIHWYSDTLYNIILTGSNLQQVKSS